MKRLLCAVVIFGSLVANGQATIDFQNDFFNHLKPNINILTEDGLINNASEVKQFVSSFSETTYNKDFSIKVNASLDYEIGEIQSNLGSFAVMFLKTNASDAQSKIEFLIIYKKSKADYNFSAIDKSRLEWMSFCNSHEAKKLVKELYTPDAYYYNRGRLLKGTDALVTEYSYMNMPSYTLKLTPKHIVAVSSNTVYEIGQCSGSYPLPYMLVWQKQENGKWQILMDSNY